VSNLVRNLVRNSLLRPLIPLKDPILFMPLERDLSLTFGVGVATFTRATTKTFVEKSSGIIKTAAIDEAAFETNGILIEGASTNLLLRSEEFDNASWTTANLVITPDTDVAPDGTTTADTFTFDGTNNARILQTVTTNTGTSNTFSVYLKGTAGETVTIELGTSVDEITLTSSFVRYSVNNPSVGTSEVIRIIDRADSALVFQVWGAQLEELPFVSSYIKTGASTVTRALGDNSVQSSNITAPADPYTVSMKFDVIGLDPTKNQVLFNVDGETSRKIEINTTTGLIEATHGAVTSISTTVVTLGTKINIAFTVGSTNQTLYVNATQEDQDAKGTVTGTATRISLANSAGVDQLFGHQTDVRIDDFELTANQVKLLL